MDVLRVAQNTCCHEGIREVCETIKLSGIASIFCHSVVVVPKRRNLEYPYLVANQTRVTAVYDDSVS